MSDDVTLIAPVFGFNEKSDLLFVDTRKYLTAPNLPASLSTAWEKEKESRCKFYAGSNVHRVVYSSARNRRRVVINMKVGQKYEVQQLVSCNKRGEIAHCFK